MGRKYSKAKSKKSSKGDNELKRINDLLKVTELLSHVKDIDALLDRILHEARQFTGADGGSIYLLEKDKLIFRYVQNHSLFKKQNVTNKYLYVNHIMAINEKSIVGHVAITGKPLIIDDAYEIKGSMPFAFNRKFDETSNYRTRSVLTVPLKTSRNTVVGVLQLINAQDADKNVIPFSRGDMLYVEHFANNAAVAIERAKMTRAMILRTMKITELRDPKETGAHVNRVGAYTIEIYHYWATKRGYPASEVKKNKDELRIAAMLHDIGKVAISDTILKKPAKLTEEEYEIMKTHAVQGARLFQDSAADWEDAAAEIALNHHEKWDGTGYPGKMKDIYTDPIKFGPGKKGEEIPIFGRIVALVDVYDALISKRCYKDAWPEEKVLKLIREESGKHFDPEVVEAFVAIYDVIQAIRDKYIEKD